MTDDPSYSSELSDDVTSVSGHADYHSPWSTSPQYPSESLLFGNTTSPYTADLALPSPSPSAASLTLTNFNDSYWSNSTQNSMHPPSANASRSFPRIHIETEFPPATVGSPYNVGSSFPHSPTNHRSPLGVMATPLRPYSSPSSSVGSAPPVTPETPVLDYGYNSPFISQGSNSPISPSLISAPVSFVPKDPLASPQREQNGVLDLAHAAGHPWGGPLVPQKTYRPHTLSDRRRYVEEVRLEAPIMFFTQNPSGCGIMLKDAIASKFSTLIDRDDSMFEGRGPSVSIRLNVGFLLLFLSHAESDMRSSGPVTHPGAGRSPRGTSAALHTPSPAPSLRGTWRRLLLASYRQVSFVRACINSPC